MPKKRLSPDETPSTGSLGSKSVNVGAEDDINSLDIYRDGEPLAKAGELLWRRTMQRVLGKSLGGVVQSVTVGGLVRLEAHSLIKAAKLVVGAPYTAEMLEQARANIAKMAGIETAACIENEGKIRFIVREQPMVDAVTVKGLATPEVRDFFLNEGICARQLFDPILFANALEKFDDFLGRHRKVRAGLPEFSTTHQHSISITISVIPIVRVIEDSASKGGSRSDLNDDMKLDIVRRFGDSKQSSPTPPDIIAKGRDSSPPAHTATLLAPSIRAALDEAGITDVDAQQLSELISANLARDGFGLRPLENDVGLDAPRLPELAPEIYQGLRGPETPPQFVQRVYGPWLGHGLDRGHVRQLDPTLYQAIVNWSRRNEWPADVDLPTRPEKGKRWVEMIGAGELSEDALKAARNLLATKERQGKRQI